MAVTIKDIAKIANVSHTTVSRALNNSPLIKEKTKQKILAIATELNYSPDVHARSLVLQKSYTIGLFFTSLSNGTSSSFLAETIRGVNSVIDEKYHLFVRGIDDFKDFSAISEKRFDGIILMSQSDVDDAFIRHVTEHKIPLVVLNRYVDNESIVNILSNDREGAYEAVKYLISEGHRDIAIIEGTAQFKSSIERKEGYVQAMLELNVPIDHKFIVKANYDMESGYEAMRSLLSLPTIPSAVFCSNDDMAIGAMKAIYEANLNVPNDISIIGFDDIGFSQYTIPALSTVKRPIEQISKVGAEKLMENVEKQIGKRCRTFLKTELVKRQSVTTIN
ncbi:LacI family DNA-binding transcriptional regulator [Metabacillus malikii]|uniref:LacI family transcriptional regulator n=1 Tax=Metabacillus malikii TaxID=1504265 RepID=A0ABT9ZL62_9BACI|nr:LacI family DNA-binding transcriptional regulator [Metabacillus malikii]MDQ0232522.1 LacI family transcriptional regulator [Metabacillus malikii]